jgi:hypothetical protein
MVVSTHKTTWHHNLEHYNLHTYTYHSKTKHMLLTCRLTTKFFTPSMTKDEPWETNFENIPTVLVPPPTYWFDVAAILAYALKQFLASTKSCLFDSYNRKINK